MSKAIKISRVIRPSAVLTASYVFTTGVDVRSCNQAALLVDFTKGSLTTGEIKAQGSQDGTTWYDIPFSNTTAGTTSSNEFLAPLRVYVHQMDASSTHIVYVPLVLKWFRIGYKGTGTVTNSLGAVTLVAGTV